MAHRDSYRQWPYLTEEEFELACHFFDHSYVQANLGPSRKILKIRLRRTMTSGQIYIQILRLLQPAEDPDDLSLAMSKLSGGEGHGAGFGMAMDTTDEDADMEAFQVTGADDDGRPPHYSLYSHQPYATYEIHLHPTYALPILWFTLNDLPNGENAFDLDAVYRHLVPEDYKSRLRAVGVTGGISAAPNPITDVPSFFIHPCQTKEAMEDFDCPLQEYLMIWLGQVGGCVGLWIPPEMSMNHES